MQVLGSFEDYVGGPAHGHHLLDPLLSLCTIDETTVRAQAVSAIEKLSAKLSPEQRFQHLAPKVMELFESAEWFTPRVSACGLVAVAFEGCKGCKNQLMSHTVTLGDKERTWKPEELVKELAEAYRKQFNDSEPMVRRTAALRLAGAARAFGHEMTKTELVDVFVRLVEEQEQESIRVNAIDSAGSIFAVASLTDPVGEKYLACAEDKSWRVRVAVSSSLPAVAEARQGHENDLRIAEETFLNLLQDQEPEVRYATAAQSAAAASVLGAQFAAEKLVPAVTALVQDDSVSNRVELAGVLLEMALPLGSEIAKDVYLSRQESYAGQAEEGCLVQLLMNDPNTNLRLIVIGKLEALINVLSIPNAGEVLTIINTLVDDKNWRIRHAALFLLPKLAKQMSLDDFSKTFIQGSFKARAEDNCALIREDWIKCCAEIGRDIKIKDEAAARDWVLNNILETLEELCGKKNYQFKSVFLHAAQELGDIVGADVLQSKFLDKAIDMQTDRVPNLRLKVAEVLGVIAEKRWISASLINEKIKPCLSKLADDTDVDVKEAASRALDAMA